MTAADVTDCRSKGLSPCTPYKWKISSYYLLHFQHHCRVASGDSVWQNKVDSSIAYLNKWMGYFPPHQSKEETSRESCSNADTDRMSSWQFWSPWQIPVGIKCQEKDGWSDLEQGYKVYVSCDPFGLIDPIHWVPKRKYSFQSSAWCRTIRITRSKTP